MHMYCVEGMCIIICDGRTSVSCVHALCLFGQCVVVLCVGSLIGSLRMQVQVLSVWREIAGQSQQFFSCYTATLTSTGKLLFPGKLFPLKWVYTCISALLLLLESSDLGT